MRWTERQRAMLREMGVRLWEPEDKGVPAVVEPEARVATTIGAEARAEPKLAAPPARDATEALALPAHVASEPAREPRMPGLAPADWLVVAEPLDAADPQQQQLLENMLRAIGIGLVAPSRDHRAVFVALDAAGTGGARGTAEPLRSALDAVVPRCVLAFGRAAAAALLGADAPLGGLRGRVHAHGGVPVVVTFSLAFLLRHPAEKAKAWADLCLAVRAIATPTS